MEEKFNWKEILFTIIITISFIALIIFSPKRPFTKYECKEYQEYYYYTTGGGYAPSITTNLDLAVTKIPEAKVYVSKEDKEKYPDTIQEQGCVKWEEVIEN